MWDREWRLLGQATVIRPVALTNHHESERPRDFLRLHLGLNDTVAGLVEEADTQSHQGGIAVDGLRGGIRFHQICCSG